MIKEERKAYAKAYNQTNKEQVKAYMKAYYEAHKEQCKASKKAYYEAHKEEHNAYMKAYFKAHKEQRKASRKAWREAHKEEVKAYMKAYAKAYMKGYIKSDVNSLGQTKQSIRIKSQRYLKKYGTMIPGYEIHHCCTYTEPYKFIYCSIEMHRLIHSYLRQHNIDADSDHYEQIKHLLDDSIVKYNIE